MTRVIYFTATTLDGFIADEQDSLDWLFAVPHGEDDGHWDDLMSRVGALVTGATTYRWMVERHDMLEHPEVWHDFYGERPCWVFSHREQPTIPGVAVHHVSGDVRPVYDAIVDAVPGKDIWVVGGGDLVGQFDDAGLLDEIVLGMTPVTLGAGAPLLPRRIESDRLSVRAAHQVGQRIRVVLDVRQ